MKNSDMQYNPWKGLTAYEVNDDKLFCGRDDDIDILQSLIEYDQIVTLYGKSGIGKTSLLCAGVIPKLANSGYVIRVIRLGEFDKVDTYAELILSRLASTDIDIDCSTKDIFTRYFHNNPIYNSYGERASVVVVLDQFEEILYKDNTEADLLLQQLAEWKHCEYDILSDCHFVISIREDDLFLLEDAIDRGRLNSLRSSRYRLKGITFNGAREIICRPGENLIESNDVIDKILSLLCENDNDSKGMYQASELSLICSQLYIAKCRCQEPFITPKLVEQYGRASIIEYYKTAVDHLSHRSITIIENEFVTENGRRSFMSIDRFNKLFSDKERNELLSGDFRILTITNMKVELIHDILARAIKQAKNEKLLKEKRIKNVFSYAAYIISSLILFYIPILWFVCKAWPEIGVFIWHNKLLEQADGQLIECLTLLPHNLQILVFFILPLSILLPFIGQFIITRLRLAKSTIITDNKTIWQKTVSYVCWSIVLIVATIVWCGTESLRITFPPGPMLIYSSLTLIIDCINRFKYKWPWRILVFLMWGVVISSLGNMILDYIYLTLFVISCICTVVCFRKQLWCQLLFPAVLTFAFIVTLPFDPITYFANLPRIKSICPSRNAMYVEYNDSVKIIGKLSKRDDYPKWPIISSQVSDKDIIGYLPIKGSDSRTQLKSTFPFHLGHEHELGTPIHARLVDLCDNLDNVEHVIKQDTSKFAREIYNPIKLHSAKLFREVMDNICDNYIRRKAPLTGDISRLDSIYNLCDKYLSSFAEEYKISHIQPDELMNYTKITTCQLMIAMLHDAIHHNEPELAFIMITNYTMRILYNEAYHHRANLDLSLNDNINVKIQADEFDEKYSVSRKNMTIDTCPYELFKLYSYLSCAMICHDSKEIVKGKRREYTYINKFYDDFMNRNIAILESDIDIWSSNLLYSGVLYTLIADGIRIQPWKIINYDSRIKKIEQNRAQYMDNAFTNELIKMATVKKEIEDKTKTAKALLRLLPKNIQSDVLQNNKLLQDYFSNLKEELY